MLLAGLTAGHKIGLAVVAACFIAFALGSSFVAPRLRPDFPGKNGLRMFAIVGFVLFAAMITAVEIFGKESEAKASAEAPAQPASSAATVQVKETEFKIVAPATVAAAGKVTFVVQNVGKIPHDLALEGAGVSASTKTPLIMPGKSAKLTATLAAGAYTIYCSVPGHRAAGMVAKLVVK